MLSNNKFFFKKKGEASSPSRQHHVGGDNKLQTCNVFNCKVVEEAHKTDKKSNKETESPFHEYVLENLDLPIIPPILLEKGILHNPKAQRLIDSASKALQILS